MSGSLEIAIVGSGSGAFAAALRAAAEGARVAMIEQGTLGGTCVNIGCVPSKILLRAAHVAHLAGRHPFEGVGRSPATIDRAAMLRQQQSRVEALRRAKYEDVLASEPRIRLLRGHASFIDERRLRVVSNDGATILAPDRILLATGARPAVPAIPGLEGTPYWTSTEALATETIPDHLIVIGGGFLALELGQAFRRLRSRVTILARSRFLSAEEPLLGEGVTEAFRAEGIRVHLHNVPTRVEHREGTFTVRSGERAIEGDRLLVATGRRPNTEGLQLERTLVSTDASGAVVVDEGLRTSAPHVWAVGDCTNLPRLVYVAAAAGTRAAVAMTGGVASLDLTTMPTVVFVDPQAAWVGLSEEEAEREGRRVESRVLPLDQVPRALVNFETRGFVKLVAGAGSRRLLGAQILAEGAGEIVQVAALAIRSGLSVDELAEELFPYLTMVEGLKLAAQTFTKDVSRLSCCAG